MGAYRQRGYGNLRLRDGIVVGLLSPVGVAVGTVRANEVPERALQIAFAAVQLFFAYRLAAPSAGPAPREPRPGSVARVTILDVRKRTATTSRTSH